MRRIRNEVVFDRRPRSHAFVFIHALFRVALADLAQGFELINALALVIFVRDIVGGDFVRMPGLLQLFRQRFQLTLQALITGESGLAVQFPLVPVRRSVRHHR